MNTKIINEVEVKRPTTTPLKSSVLDHATVVPTKSFGWSNNEGLWVSYNTLRMLSETALCPDPEAEMKDFAHGTWTPAFEFAVYGGIQCSNVGLDRADMLNEAKRVFDLNAGRGIEEGLRDTRFIADPLHTPDWWAAPTDVSVTGLTGILAAAAALAALEGYAAETYAGVPTIHMPRAVASLLNERIVWEGDLAYTRMGSKVAMGGGYDNHTAFTGGDFTLYATGEVVVQRGGVDAMDAYVIPGDGLNTETDSGNDFTDNSSLVLVEEMFRVAVDGFTAKATGSLA